MSGVASAAWWSLGRTSARKTALTSVPGMLAEPRRMGVAWAAPCSWATRVRRDGPRGEGNGLRDGVELGRRKTAGLRSETGRPEKERRKRAFGPKAREGEERNENSFSFLISKTNFNYEVNRF